MWEPTRRCQFSNWMSSSQFQCHRDVINDTKVRIGANTSRTAWRRGAGSSAWVPSTRSRNRFSMKLSSRCGVRCGGLIGLVVTQYRRHDVEAAAGKCQHGLGAAFPRPHGDVAGTALLTTARLGRDMVVVSLITLVC